MLNNKIKVFVTCVTIGNVATAAPPIAVTKDQATQALTSLSVPFEENRGQADAKVAFQAKTLAGPLFVTKTGELVWSLTPPSPNKPERAKSLSKQPAPAQFVGPPQPSYSVVEKFVGGTPKPAGAKAASTQVSYFHGNDRSKWQNSVPTWNQISLGQVWPGIEVSLAARGKNAEKLFTVAPGADASKISIEVKGGNLAVAKDGGLSVIPPSSRGRARVGVETIAKSEPPSQPSPLKGEGVLKFTAPVAWQEINGERKPVTVAYRLAAANQYGFTLGTHDATQPVVIDPLIQSTYLGGSEEDWINAIAVTANAVYVAGYTLSSDFPGTSGGTQSSLVGGDGDAFVAKLNLDLTSLSQASFLGGSDNDYAYALAVSSDAVYVAGGTGSSDFPGTSGGAQSSFGGCGDYGCDAFIAKLNLDLTSLGQASFLGGSSRDDAYALAVSSDAVYVAGDTNSSDCPSTSGGAQGSFGGGDYDAFVAKLNLDLTSLTQVTYLGGNDWDFANAIAVTSNSVYVAGSTFSSNFPGTSGGAQSSNSGGGDSSDAFIAKLNLDLTSLTQASYLGGSGGDYASVLAVSSNAVYVAGQTSSNNFPSTSGGAQGSFGGDSYDAFVAKLNVDLTSLAQASYLGGSGYDYAPGLAVSSSAVYVTGITTIPGDFPGTSGGAQGSYGGGSCDAFIAKLNVDLTTLTQASYLGGSDCDFGTTLAVTSNAVYVAGDTSSSDFPGTSGGAQTSFGGGTCGTSPDTYPCYDAFIARLTPDLRGATAPTTVTKVATGITATRATLNGTVTPNGAITTVTFDFGTTTSYGQSIAPVTITIPANAPATAASANKTGLLCNTTYNYRVKAVNSAGTTYGANVSFKTAACPVTVPVAVTKAATGVTAVAATLNGTVTPNGAATTVTFDFGTTTAYGQSVAAVPGSIAVGAAATAVRASKTALVCNTTYNYRVKAVNSKGTSYGANVSFKTTACLGPIVGTNPATGITATGATLNGTVTPNGAATTVTFDFGTTTSYGTSVVATPNSIAVGAAATAVRASKTGLVCNTTYNYRVKAVNSRGTSYGANVSFKTAACSVSRPDLVVTAATLTPATPVAGNTFSVTLTVKNQGTLAANGNFLDVWTNQATAQTCGAAGDNWAYVDALAVGASTTITVTDLTADVAGAKTLRVFVDSACGIVEVNETNNQMTKAYTVQ